MSEEDDTTDVPRKFMEMLGTTVNGWQIIKIWPRRIGKGKQVKSRCLCPLCGKATVIDVRDLVKPAPMRACLSCTTTRVETPKTAKRRNREKLRGLPKD